MDPPISSQMMTVDNVFMVLCVVYLYNYLKDGYNHITPIMIKEAESALLSWEKDNPNELSSSLLSVIHYYNYCYFEKKIPKLAVLLTLKALVKMRWKERGRRNQKKDFILLCEEVKNQIRNAILSIVTTGALDVNNGSTRDLSCVLLNNRPLQVYFN